MFWIGLREPAKQGGVPERIRRALRTGRFSRSDSESPEKDGAVSDRIQGALRTRRCSGVDLESPKNKVVFQIQLIES